MPPTAPQADAPGARSPRPPRLPDALHRQRRRNPGRRTAELGPGGTAASPSTSSTARPKSTWWSATAAEIMDIRPGSMGQAVPGHEVEVVDAAGASREPRAKRARSPSGGRTRSCSSNTGTTPKRPPASTSGDWCLTGDLAAQRRRRLLLVCRPQGRRHHQRRLPHRSGRGRGMPC